MTADTRLANGVRSQPRKRISDFWIDAALLAPGCGFLLLAMAVPIAQLLLASVGLFGLGRTTAFTVANYARIADDVLLRSGLSPRIALATMATASRREILTALLRSVSRTPAGRRPLQIPLSPSLGPHFWCPEIGPGGMAARLLAPLDAVAVVRA
jgi:hypothetical protein